jgi:hypothetical protein
MDDYRDQKQISAPRGLTAYAIHQNSESAYRPPYARTKTHVEPAISQGERCSVSGQPGLDPLS